MNELTDKEKMARELMARSAPKAEKRSAMDQHIIKTLKDTVRLHIPLTDIHCIGGVVAELRQLATQIEQTTYLNTRSQYQKLHDIYYLVRAADQNLGDIPLSKRLGRDKTSESSDDKGGTDKPVNPLYVVG